MTVDRKNLEINRLPDKTVADGIGNGNKKPNVIDIIKLLKIEGFKSYKIKIWHDDTQKSWRWNCEIKDNE